MFTVLTVKTKSVTSSAQTVVPGLVVIVGFLGSSISILTTLEGKPAPPVGQSTELSVAKVSLRISVSTKMFKGVSDISNEELVAPAILVHTFAVLVLRSCH